MAQIRETRYICDSCGVQVEKKSDLRKFEVIQFTKSGSWGEVAMTDLCAQCEPNFLKLVRPFFDDSKAGTIDDMARDG